MSSPSLTFEQFKLLQADYWKVERLEGLDFEFVIEPFEALGPDVFYVRQCGFSLEALIKPKKKFLAVCKMLSGENIVYFGDRLEVFSHDYHPVFLASNAAGVRSLVCGYEMLMLVISSDIEENADFDLYNMVSDFIIKFDFSFEDICLAVNVFRGAGPLRPRAHGTLPLDDDYKVAACMFANFSRGIYSLKLLAEQNGVSVPTISRVKISGLKVTEWSRIWKLNIFNEYKDKCDILEVARKMGYRSASNMRDFLWRNGVSYD